jgi:hypothetical protein
MDNLSTASGAAVISLAGFAIQRALQVLDPLIDLLVDWTKPWWVKHGSADGDFKRAVMALGALILGMTLAGLLDIQLLASAGMHGHPCGDFVVSGLVLSAGCEGANSVLKTLEAFKQARQPSDDGVVVAIATPDLTVKAGTVVQLRATVANCNTQRVAWSAVEKDLVVVSGEGTFTAPAAAATYHVVATSVASPSKSAVAKITVTA